MQRELRQRPPILAGRAELPRRGQDVRVGRAVGDKQRWWSAPFPNPWLRISVPLLTILSINLLWPTVRGREAHGADRVLVGLFVISAAAAAIGIAVWVRERNRD